MAGRKIAQPSAKKQRGKDFAFCHIPLVEIFYIHCLLLNKLKNRGLEEDKKELKYLSILI